jgi:glycopeptide antibiotics resistance protein
VARLVEGVDKEQRDSPVHWVKIYLTWRKDRYPNLCTVSHLARCFSSEARRAPLPQRWIPQEFLRRTDENRSRARLLDETRVSFLTVMRILTIEPQATSRSSSWSNRFLIAALVGILFLTLFPFRFDFQSRLPGGTSPFFLGNGAKTAGLADAFLNVLLFIPLGFGLAEKLRERKIPRAACFFIVYAAGAFLSYAIEITQIYIPMRDSGWEDVFTNSTGSILGFLVYELLGALIIDSLSKLEIALRARLTLQRSAALLAVYFLFWFTVSAVFQKQTRLSNWEPDGLLVVGNEATGQSPWQGRVQRLQIADQAAPDAAAIALTSGHAAQQPPFAWRADYDFSSPTPFQDSKEFLPSLSWAPAAALSQNSNGVTLDGKSWLTSQAAVADLVDDIRKTNQFSLHIICAAAQPHTGNGHIVSISRSPWFSDLTLRQEESSLVFWFRSPLSIKRAILAWYVPNVFTDAQERDILYSYDGADLSLYINGKKSKRPYRLGPGTSLARLLHQVRPAELDGYNDIYYALVFFPVGIILGLAKSRIRPSNVTILLATAFGLLVPVCLLEFILVQVSGRPVFPSNVLLSFLLLIAGFLWIRSDSVQTAVKRAG